jgi:hypothetical protein
MPSNTMELAAKWGIFCSVNLKKGTQHNAYGTERSFRG